MALRGECNQCGLCCHIGDARCVNLVLVDKPGLPMASRCGVYKQRVDGMPILLRKPDDSLIWGECWIHKEEVIETYIGKGCSYEREE